MKINESSKVTTTSGGRWRARLISEGQGSSGVYPAHLLRERGPKIWPEGTHVYFDHLSSEDPHNGSHSVKDLVGVIEGTPEFDEGDNGLYGNIKFFSQHQKMMEEIAPYVGLSIEASGELDDDGNVISLFESPLNAVAVVPRAGRDGKLVSMIESFRESSDRIDDEPNPIEREPMNEQEIKALAEALAEAIKPEFAALTEALTPKAPEVEETETDFAAVVEAAVEADLSKTSRTRVVEAVKAGKPVDEAINAEKALRDEILKESAVETPGSVVGSETGTRTRIEGWK